MLKISTYHPGGIMAIRSQKSPLQRVAIWAGLTLLGMPLIWLLFVTLVNALNLYLPPSPGSLVFLLASSLVAWFAFCIAIRRLTRWLGIRTALIGAVIFLLGVPIAAVLSANITLQNLVTHALLLNPPWVNINANWAITFWFLTLWSLLSGLFTRSARAMYVALHLANWLLWLGIISSSSGLLPLLIFPLGIMLLLLGFYKPIIRGLASLPLFQKTSQPDAAPKPASPQDYEQGYRAAYKEGGNIYMYPDEEDIPTVYSPRAQSQQQH
jgi:hypothetical protein